MKRHAPYTELRESPPVAPSQRQHLPAPQAPHASRRNYSKGNPDPLSADEALSSKAAKVEWMWQRERDAIAPTDALPSHDEAPGPSHPEEQVRTEPNSQPHEREMEIGYEDDRPSLTLGGLEQKFFEEVMELVKEQNDSEDAENTCHRERIIEINNHYRDRLSSLCAQQAHRRSEFLLKEQKQHLGQHQEVPRTAPLPNTMFRAHDARDVDPIPFAPTSRELLARHSNSTSLQDAYRDRPICPSSRGAQTQETERRVPLPAGLVYNTSFRYQ